MVTFNCLNPPPTNDLTGNDLFEGRHTVVMVDNHPCYREMMDCAKNNQPFIVYIEWGGQIINEPKEYHYRIKTDMFGATLTRFWGPKEMQKLRHPTPPPEDFFKSEESVASTPTVTSVTDAQVSETFSQESTPKASKASLDYAAAAKSAQVAVPIEVRSDWRPDFKGKAQAKKSA